MRARFFIPAIAFWLLGSGGAAACVCYPTDFENHFRMSGLIFDGVAISTRTLKPEERDGSDSSLFNLVTTFRVTRAIKGVGPETREVRHHTYPGSCGIGFKIGETYQVYASRGGGRFYISSCSRTGDLQQAHRLRSLGPKKRPEPAGSLGGVIRQMRDPKLEEIDAELLFYDFQRREKEKEAEEFIRSYIERAESAAEKAAGGRISIFDGSGALPAAKFYEYWDDYERAAEMYALAERVVPRDARFPAAQGRVLYHAGRSAAAIPHLERALRLDAHHPGAAVLLAKARLLSKGRLTPGVFDYRNLKAPALTLDRAEHPGIDLTGAHITRLSAQGARLPGAKLSDAEIGQADFRKADISGAVFVEAKMQNADFTGANLSNAYAFDAEFSKARFARADLSGFEAARSWFLDADLRGARLEGANFRGSDFTRTRLEEAHFRNADFSGATLTNATLHGADLRGGKFEQTDFAGARIDCKTRLPKGLNIRQAGLIAVLRECNGRAQNRDFSGRQWDGTDFSGLDLESASFSGARFSNSSFNRPDFTLASLRHADFSQTSGPALFYGADLSGTDFSGSHLDAAFEGRAARDGRSALPPARLKGTRFTGARLETKTLIGSLPWQDPPKRPDYRNATYEKAHIQCSTGHMAEGIEREAKEDLKPEDPSEDPYWKGYSEIQRRKFRQWMEEAHVREVRQRRLQAAHIEAERRLLAWLKENWPSATFDENCRYYLASSEEKLKN